MDNYTLSNSIESLPKCNLSTETKRQFVLLREKAVTTENDLQAVASSICSDLKVPNVCIIFRGVQNCSMANGKLRSKTLGTYQTGTAIIKIAQFTAVKRKEIAPKTAFDTLLHELMHHFDFKILGLTNSIHSSGFYKRIGALKETLLK